MCSNFGRELHVDFLSKQFFFKDIRNCLVSTRKNKKSKPFIGLNPIKSIFILKSLDMKGVCMCKALTELIADGKQEGREEGKQLGKDEKLRELVVKKVKKGLSVSEIADVLEEDEETIRKIIESLK